MKRKITMVVGMILMLTTVACGSKTTKEESLDSSSAQIPNPFITCETIDEAIQLAGFEFVLPEKMPSGYAQSTILVIDKEMIEVNYKNEKEQDLYLRKANGEDDISGDYNEYKEQESITIDGRDINLKGNDGLVNVAIWQDGNYSFAIGVNNGGTGIDNDSMREMIKNLK